MEKDKIDIFFGKYFSKIPEPLTLKLSDGRILNGVIISFSRNCDKKSPCFTSFHIVSEKYRHSLGIDDFGFLIGEIININEITAIKLNETWFEMKCGTTSEVYEKPEFRQELIKEKQNY